MGVEDFDLAAAANSLTGDFFGASIQVGADQSYVTPRLAETQGGSAFDSMTPIQAGSSEDAYGWLKDLAKTTVGYLIQKDAQQNQVVPPRVYEQTVSQATGNPVQPRQQGGSGLLLVLLAVGGLVIALKD